MRPEPENTNTILPAATADIEGWPMMEPLLLTPRAAARILSISERTLYSLTVPRGEIPVIRAGRLVRYSVDDLKAWIKKTSENS